MRDTFLVGLVTGALVVMIAGAAAAQDEPEPRVILAPPEYELERLEIPDAGLAMLVPVGWDVEVRMERDELQLPPEHADRASVESIEVVYAEDGMGDWCSLSTFGDLPLSPEEHALWDVNRFEAGTQGDLVASDSIWVIGGEIGHMLELAPSSGIGGVQEFVWDLDGTRTTIMCASPYAANRSWQQMADSVEPLRDDGPVDVVAETTDDAPADAPSIELVGKLQHVAVPEAGIAVSFPADWDVEVQMESQELSLPAGYEDTPPATEWSVLYAPIPGAAGWCSLVMVTDMPMPFEDWADTFIPDPDAGGRPVSVDAVELPIGESVRVHDEYVADELLFATLYLFESGGAYYWLGCAQGAPAEDYWLGIAETLEPLGDGMDDTIAPHVVDAAGEQPIEVPGAGISIAFPPDWAVEVEMIADQVVSSDADEEPIDYLNVLYAERDDGSWCQLQRYETQVDDLTAFADSLAGNYLAEYGEGATAVASMIELDVGEAGRVEALDPAESRVTLVYAFTSDTALYELSCMGGEDVPPVVDAIAGSLAWPGSTDGLAPAHGPDVESADAVTGFRSEVEVADEMLMSADCQLAAWVAFSDGTFREWIDCALSDAPVSQPEWQGVRPHELLTVRGGECEWTSDYWAVTDGSEVWATSYELTIRPDGRVFGTSFYAPEMLACDD